MTRRLNVGAGLVPAPTLLHCYPLIYSSCNGRLFPMQIVAEHFTGVEVCAVLQTRVREVRDPALRADFLLTPLRGFVFSRGR